VETLSISSCFFLIPCKPQITDRFNGEWKVVGPSQGGGLVGCGLPYILILPSEMELVVKLMPIFYKTIFAISASNNFRDI